MKSNPGGFLKGSDFVIIGNIVIGLIAVLIGVAGELQPPKLDKDGKPVRVVVCGRFGCIK